jgi:hypothetical protein
MHCRSAKIWHPAFKARIGKNSVALERRVDKFDIAGKPRLSEVGLA